MPLREHAERLRPYLRGKWLHILVGASISVGLTWLVLRSIHWADVGEAFRTFPVGLMLIALIPLVLSMLLRSARWHVLLKGERASLRQVFLTQSTGIGLNNLLPVRMVSEPVQLAIITVRYRVPFPVALASLLAGNVMDIIASATLLAVGVTLTPGLRGVFGGILVGGMALAALSMVIFFVAARGLSALPFAKGIHFFQQLSIALAMQRRKPGRLALSFLATLGHWLLLGLAAWIIGRGMGMDVSLLFMATLMAATTFFIAAVPSLPGAVGTFEFAMVFILERVGVDSAPALSLALVMHALIFLPTSVIALGMLSRYGSGFIKRASGGGKDRDFGSFLSSATPSGASGDEADQHLVHR
ncbi:MAG: lysylphosphatidylglycerol synthase transmembrane domain-containing protein [Dehalococcoidia bacterium]